MIEYIKKTYPDMVVTPPNLQIGDLMTLFVPGHPAYYKRVGIDDDWIELKPKEDTETNP